VTHDPALAARADRRVHIVDGKIDGTTLLSDRTSVAVGAAAAGP
jgi:ABC-type lipoprotein export system ATPase subunit